MLEDMRNYAISFLDSKIGSDEFIQICKKTYDQAICNPAKVIELNTIIVLPFVHEFAYCKYDDLELKSQVLFFLSVLSGNQAYHYSSFFKISPPDITNKLEFALYHNFKDIDLVDLYPIFAQSIESPLTLRDILNNSIFDILSDLNLEQPGESFFNYVNCSENLSFSQVRERLLLLLSYYLGLKTFFVQVSIFTNNRIVYTIV